MTRSGKEHFLKLLEGFQHGMLITYSQQGALHARPMVVAQVDQEAQVWLLTDVHSEKVEELKHDARLSVTFQNKDTYLALSGCGELVCDPEKVHRLWREPWRAWFSHGCDDPALVFIRVHPSYGEYWDTDGFNRFKFFYKTAKAYITGRKPPSDQDLQAKIALRR